jgi:mRNA interferase MazF
MADAQDAVMANVTTAPPRGVTDVELHDWRASGLRLPSTARLSHLDCLEGQLLLQQIGRISAADGQRVKDVWSQQVKPQF